MHQHDHAAAINQKIFKLGLPVEAISAYLLCCGLNDAGTSITIGTLQEVWNSTKDQLKTSVAILEERKILSKIMRDGEKSTVYRLMPVERWKAEPAK
ncbi:MAG: hypothetical protein QNI92_14385 [Desulfobacterales bacterium]|nr:hypothetical protein [Desulfobacterales bacterium]